MALPKQLDLLNWSHNPPTIDNPYITDWLTDISSLTAKLKASYQKFSVEIINETTTTLSLNETHFFQELSKNTTYHHRQVLLLGDDKPKVYAQSIIPNTKDTSHILPLGTQPLGEVLFKQPSLNRQPSQFAKTKNGIWGRRAIFYFYQTPILIYEFFLDV